MSVYTSLLVLLSNPNVVPCHIWIDLKFILSCNGVSRLAILDSTLQRVTDKDDKQESLAAWDTSLRTQI